MFYTNAYILYYIGIHFYIRVHACTYTPTCKSRYPSICLSLSKSPSNQLSIYQSIYRSSKYMNLYLSIRAFLHVHTYLFPSTCGFLSASTYVILYPSVLICYAELNLYLSSRHLGREGDRERERESQAERCPGLGASSPQMLRQVP